jgi:hypothetical protein
MAVNLTGKMRIPTSPGNPCFLDGAGDTPSREVPGDVAQGTHPLGWRPLGFPHPLQPAVESPYAFSQARNADLWMSTAH